MPCVYGRLCLSWAPWLPLHLLPWHFSALCGKTMLFTKGAQDWCCFPAKEAAKLQSPPSLGRCQQFKTFVKDNNRPCSLKLCSGFEAAQGRWLWPADGDGLWKEAVGWKEGSRALVSLVTALVATKRTRGSPCFSEGLRPHRFPPALARLPRPLSPQGWPFASATLGSCLSPYTRTGPTVWDLELKPVKTSRKQAHDKGILHRTVLLL